MAVGRISGPLLKANLERNGIDLAVETSLLYIDVNNGRIGINTTTPHCDLDVNGTICSERIDTNFLTVASNYNLGNVNITSTVGNLELQPATEFDRTVIQGDLEVTGSIIGYQDGFTIADDGSTTAFVGLNTTLRLSDGDDMSVVISTDGTHEVVTFSNTSTLDSITSRGNTTLNSISVSSIDGDLQGSVFGDDSTLIIDGINNSVIATSVTTPQIVSATTLNVNTGGDFTISSPANIQMNATSGAVYIVSPITDLSGILQVSTIDSADSSAITFVPSVTFESDVAVQNDLNVTNTVSANQFIGDGSQLTGLIANFAALNDTAVDGQAANTLIRYDGAFYVPSSIIEDANGNVTIGNELTVTTGLFTPLIDTADSSALTITPSTVFSSDVTVENILYLNNPPDFGTPVDLPSGSTIGGVPIGSTEGGGDADTLNLQPGSYYLDAANLTGNVPADFIRLGIDTIGGFVENVVGTANEIEIIGDSTTESATLTVGLPDNVTIGNELTITTGLFTPLIDTADSSALTITPSTLFSSNVTVENDLVVTNKITAAEFIGDGSQLTGLIASYADLSDTDITGRTTDSLTRFNGVNYVPTLLSEDASGNVTIAGQLNVSTIDTADSSALTITPSTLFSSNVTVENDLVVTNKVTAAEFIGDGSQLTNLTAANLTGAVPNNFITLGQDTTGNYVRTATGTLNEIQVQFSGVESADIQIGLPDNVTIGGELTVTTGLFTPLIDTADSSALTITPATTFSSDVTVENDLVVTNKITATAYYGDGSNLTGISTTTTYADLTDTDITGRTTDSLTRFDGANYVPTAMSEDASGNVTISGQLNVNIIDTADSSAITITPAAIFSSDVTVENDLNVTNDVIISGNLTVQGTTTQVDSNVVNIGDSIITLNSDETGTPTQNAGIEVERGTSANVQLIWNESTDKWQVTEDGTIYYNILTNQGDQVALGTDTTGDYIATITGTANEVEVTGSGGETAAVTIGLPDNVTIGGELTVTTGLFTPLIDTADSSALTITPSAVFSSDVTVENILYLNNPPDFGAPVDLPSGSTLNGVPLGTTEGGGDADTLNGQPGSYYLDGANFTGSLPNDYVTLGTDTTGNYVATISGTANEVEVIGSGSETAAVTIGLPDNVTIGNELTVTTGLFTPLIDTADSSALTITPSTVFSSDVTVENDLVVTNKITATEFVGVTYANLDDVDITGRTNNSLTKFDGTNYVPTLLKEFSDGDLRPGKDIEMLDNQYIVLGGGRDLQLFSDGTTGIIQSPFEPLKIRVPATGTSPTADGLIIQSTTNETLASFLPNYGVYLYFDDVLKLETTPDGITVHGDVSQDSASTLSFSTLSTATIDSLDSSAVTIVPAAVFNSDVTVENDLVVTNKITATEYYGDGSNLTGISTTTTYAALTDTDITGRTTDSLTRFDGINYVPTSLSEDASGNVTIAGQLNVNTIDTADSSAITIIPAAIFSSDVTVENDLIVTNKVTASAFIGDGSQLTNINVNNIPGLQNEFVNLSDTDVSGQTTNTLIKFNGVNYVPTQLTEDSSGNITVGGDYIEANEFIFNSVISPSRGFIYEGGASDIYYRTGGANSKNSVTFGGGGLLDHALTLNGHLETNTKIITPQIETGDSSPLTVVSATNFNSDVTVENDLNVNNDVIISGNLTVQGTTTQVDSNVVNIGDSIITLNSDETGTPSQNAGIEVERGTSANVQFIWNESTDKWQVTEDGASYYNVLTDAGDQVALGADTTGDYIATIAGTANEVDVTGSGGETAAVTIGLPNDVTIGNNLTVTAGLFTPLIDTADSSALTITPAAIFSSDVTVENDLVVSNKVTATAYYGDGSNLTGISTTTTYADLTDTDIAGRTTNSLTRFDGANYVPTAMSEDASGNVTITGQLNVSVIDTADSSALIITPATTFSSDLTVENDLVVTNKVTATEFIGNGSQLTNINANSITSGEIPLGTRTSGNYVATITGAANEIEVTGSGFETAAVTIGLPDNVTIGGELTVTTGLFTPLIDTADSSALTITPATTFSSDVTVENILYLNNPPDFGTPVDLPSGSTLGGVPIGTTEGGGDADTLNLQPGSYYLDAANLTGNVPADFIRLGIDTVGGFVENIIGTANEIEIISDSTTESATLTVGLPDNVTIGNELTVTTGLFTPLIDTADSSSLTVTPATTFSSDVTVENDLVVTNKITATAFYGDGSNLTGVSTTTTYAALTDTDITGRTNDSLTRFDGANYVPTLLLEDASGNVTVAGQLNVSIIDTADSSAITITPAVIFSSNITVENDLVVTNKVSAAEFIGNGSQLTNINANNITSGEIPLGTRTSGNYVATIAGTANEVEVIGSGSETAAVTIGLPDNVTIGNELTVTTGLFTPLIDTADSSALTITPSTVFSSDVTVENDLVVTNKITATAYYGDGSNLTGISTTTTYAALTDTDITGRTTDSLTRFDGVNYVPTALSEDASGNVTIAGQLNVSVIDTADSSSITVTPAAIFNSDVTVENDLNVTNDVIISGNLTVQGTTTQVDSNVVNIGDSIITLNSDETGTPTQNAGIEVERGTSTNVQFIWNESTDKWQVTEDGSNYYNILTDAGDQVALGTDTTGDYIATITGTANEVEVTGSGGETAAVTIGLPNDVTISGELTVTTGLFTPLIDTADSSALTITPSTVFSSDVTVENILYLNNPPDFGAPVDLPSGSTLGGVPIGTTEGGGDADTLNLQPGSYYLDAANLTGNVPADFIRLGIDTIGGFVENIVGTTNEIEIISDSTTESATLTVGLPDDVTIGNELTVTTGLFTPLIDTADSSTLTITPAAIFNSDVTIENDLNVTNDVTADRFFGDGSGLYNINGLATIVGRTEEFPTVTDGSPTVTMSSAYDIDALDVFLNGVRLRPSTDYTVSGTDLTFNENLTLDDTVAIYIFKYATKIEEFPTVVNGSADVTLSDTYSLSQLDVYLNGSKLKPTTDFTLAGTTLTFSNTLVTDDIVSVIVYSEAVIGGGQSFASLSDVDVAGQATDTLIRYNGNDYVPTATTEDASGNVTITGQLNVSAIDSADSSSIFFTPATVFESDVYVQNDLDVTNDVVANAFYGDGSNLTGITVDTSFVDLSDTNVIGQTTNTLIKYNGSEYVPTNLSENASGDVTVGSKLNVSLIDSADSSTITVTPAVQFQSDIIVDNDVKVTNNLNINDIQHTVANAVTYATTAASSITNFPGADYSSGNIIIQVKDNVTSQVQICKISIVHDTSTVSTTEYSNLYTGGVPLATFTGVIRGGYVHIDASGASNNSTTYKVVKTLLKFI